MYYEIEICGFDKDEDMESKCNWMILEKNNLASFEKLSPKEINDQGLVWVDDSWYRQ